MFGILEINANLKLGNLVNGLYLSCTDILLIYVCHLHWPKCSYTVLYYEGECTYAYSIHNLVNLS